MNKFLFSTFQSDACCREPQRPKLALSEKALKTNSLIVGKIKELYKGNYSCPLEPGFLKIYREILTLFGLFQREVIEESTYKVTCTEGCTSCCSHWVEDVYSFEGEIIADYFRRQFPEKVEEIKRKFREDEECLIRLDEIVTIKMEKVAADVKDEASKIDPVDLLLASFYQLNRPCAFLTKENLCSIYKVRPLTCRIYISFSDPSQCDPSNINGSETMTYLCDMEEEANEILDRIHKRYERFNGDMGLRSLVYKYLSINR